MLTLNDSATVGAAATANAIFSAFSAALGNLSQPIVLEWPCANGLVVSAVPTGGEFAVSYS